MRKVIGVSCIVLGIVCLLSSAGFVVYNHFESKSVEVSSNIMLQDLQTKIEKNSIQPQKEDTVRESGGETVLADAPQEMPALQVEGYNCIGILSIPVLEIELPVLGDWSYAKLRKAPCQYYGSCYDTDFVIAAHNYRAHFGRLSELQPEDLVLFTDTAGETHCYEVVLLETLSATATEEMITSGFDLSLYTCTPGGGSRVTVRCRRTNN